MGADVGMAPNSFSSINLREIRLDNGESYVYRHYGHGPKTLLLVHGNLSSSILWDLLMVALSADEYTIFAPDLRGFGGSSYHQPIKTIRDFSDDLILFARALRLKTFSAMGWSMGGLITLQMAADHPQTVLSLALLGTSAYAIPVPKTGPEGTVMEGQFWTSREDMAIRHAGIRAIIESKDEENLVKALNWAVYRVNKPSPRQHHRYAQEIFRQRNKLDADFATVCFNISHIHNGISQGTGEIDNIICPVLVFQGDQDLVVPVKYGLELKEMIGENARLVMLDNTSHSPLVDSLDKVIVELNTLTDQAHQ